MKLPELYTPHIRIRAVFGVYLLSAIWLAGIWLYVSAYENSNERQRQALVADTATHTARIEELTDARLAREKAERKETADAITASIVAGYKSGSISIPESTMNMTCNHAWMHSDPTKVDALVNKQHCVTPLGFTPKQLVDDGAVSLTKPAYAAYQSLRTAAANAGVTLTPTSSYRSFGLQVVSYADWYGKLGSSRQANEVSALPGYSEHQLGLAVDLRSDSCALDCFRSTSAYTWLTQHAYKYGFIERYPLGKESVTGYNAEAWHWRYVGVDIATDMRTRSITTLEELWDMPGGDY